MKIFVTSIVFFVSFLHGNTIESNIIKAHANTEDSIVVDGPKVREIKYLTPTIIEEEKINRMPVPIPVIEEKDYTDASILLYKNELDKNHNNFAVNMGNDDDKGGQFVSNEIIGKYAQSRAVEESNANTIVGKRNMSGVCYVKNDIFVSSKVMAKLKCKTSENEYLHLIFSLTPQDKAYSLTASIVSLIDGGGSLHQVMADKSFVSNYNGATNNIATSVNTHRVEKRLALLGKGITDGAVNAGNLAVDQLRQSMTNDQVVIANSGLTGQVVQTSQTRRPTTEDLQDYGVIGAATGILKGIGNVVDDIAKNDLSWSYKIENNSLLQFNLVY